MFGVALLAGGINSVAGGGSFLTFPALIFTGVAPIQANTTSTVAVWPGSIASIGAYRGELAKLRGGLLMPTVMSLIGGIIGSILLLKTSQSFFSQLVPYLLLVATLLFAFGKYITDWVRAQFGSRSGARSESRRSFIGAAIVQLVIAVYGGFFGAGMGIILLATFAILGMEDIHSMNAQKALLTTFINGVAVVTFVVAGAIIWPKAILMIVGAVLGGYFGGYFAQKIDPRLVRRCVIVYGFALTGYFFIHG